MSRQQPLPVSDVTAGGIDRIALADAGLSPLIGADYEECNQAERGQDAEREVRRCGEAENGEGEHHERERRRRPSSRASLDDKGSDADRQRGDDDPEKPRYIDRDADDDERREGEPKRRSLSTSSRPRSARNEPWWSEVVG